MLLEFVSIVVLIVLNNRWFIFFLFFLLLMLKWLMFEFILYNLWIFCVKDKDVNVYVIKNMLINVKIYKIMFYFWCL